MSSFIHCACLVVFISIVPMMALASFVSHTYSVYDPQLVDVAIGGISSNNASFLYAGHRSFLFAQYAPIDGQFKPMSHFAFQPRGHFIHSVVSTVLPPPKRPDAGQHVVTVASSDMGSGASSSEIYWLRYHVDVRIPRLVCYGPTFTSLLTSDFQIVSLEDPLVERVAVLDQHSSTLYFLSAPMPLTHDAACHEHTASMEQLAFQAMNGTLSAKPVDMACPWLAVPFAKSLRPTSMAVDSVKQLLYVSCKGDHIIRILDIRTGQLVGHFGWNGVGGGQLLFDSTRRLLYIHYPYFRDTESVHNPLVTWMSDAEAGVLVEHVHVLDVSKLELPLTDKEAPCTFSALPLQAIYFTKPGERVKKMVLDSASGILHLLSYYTSEPDVYLWTSYAPPSTLTRADKEPCRFIYVGDVVAQGLQVDPLTGNVLFYGYHRATNTSTLFQFPFSREECLASAQQRASRASSEPASPEAGSLEAAIQEQIKALALEFERREAAEQTAFMASNQR